MRAVLTLLFLCCWVLQSAAQLKPVDGLPVRVNYSKTVHLVFPSSVQYCNSVLDFVIADNPAEAPFILRLKANTTYFSGRSTISVATLDGKFYSFNVTYMENLPETYHYISGGRLDSRAAEKIGVNAAAQTHVIAPDRIVYIDFGDDCILADKAENTENILKIETLLENFPVPTNVSFATADGQFYSYDVEYHVNPDSYVFEISSLQARERSGQVILTDKKIVGESKDDLTSRVKGQRRQIFDQGIKQNKIIFSLHNCFIHNQTLLFVFEFTNEGGIPYDVDYTRFLIADKKTRKLTASQEIELSVEFMHDYKTLIPAGESMMFIVALDKFTIPDDKVFVVYINEKDGGRHVSFKIDNNVIINSKPI